MQLKKKVCGISSYVYWSNELNNFSLIEGFRIRCGGYAYFGEVICKWGEVSMPSVAFRRVGGAHRHIYEIHGLIA